MWRISLLVFAGCILPVSTGAPQPATTVGQGHIGLALSAEAPVLDLIADNKGSGSGSNNDDFTDSYAESPAAASTLTLAYGFTDDTDLEVALEGALYAYIFPVPTGASIGLRHHLLASDNVDIAIAGRIGGVSSGSTNADASGNATSDQASAIYGALQGVIQMRNGLFRPLLALNLMPFQIARGIEGNPIQHFDGFATSGTIGLMLVGKSVQFGPYVTITNFESEHFSGATFVSGGLMVAFRPDRNPPAQVMPVVPNYAPAGTYYPAAPAPYYPPPPPPAQPPPAAPPGETPPPG